MSTSRKTAKAANVAQISGNVDGDRRKADFRRRPVGSGGSAGKSEGVPDFPRPYMYSPTDQVDFLVEPLAGPAREGGCT